MDDKSKEINILENESNIFSNQDNDVYVIPIYQRAFAWGKDQLEQLVIDINNIDLTEEKNYYLGTLVVSKNENEYEVIDGQQRLTALYLLFLCLDIKVKDSLKFSCREKSDEILKRLKPDNQKADNKESSESDSSIEEGFKILKDFMKQEGIKKEDFEKKLEKVVVFRVEVPENTDMNRYFETMNTRGVQLEHQDIVKAKLMGNLGDNDDREAFAKMWDACSDMADYVQMHFEPNIRKEIFGRECNSLPTDDWSKFVDCFKKISESTESNNTEENETAKSIEDIIKEKMITDKPYKSRNDFDSDPDKRRFKSIIEFPYLLLHALKVFIQVKDIREKLKDKPESEKQISISLDDKKLVESFLHVLNNGEIDGQPISANKKDFSEKFIIFLLRIRYVFDRFIIKKDENDDNSDEKWSIKMLINKGDKINIEYINSHFDKETRNDESAKKNRMIQSALRVTYTGAQSMNWITELLLWLSKNNFEDFENKTMECYCDKAEEIAKEKVGKYLKDNEENRYYTGTNTPHIVLNYLDYLLWKEKSNGYEKFEFSYRDTVEHWYPQHPTVIPVWKDVDRFGNLCLLQRKLNSRFSNFTPETKKQEFAKRMDSSSLKLKLMMENTVKGNNKEAYDHWKDTNCADHETKMLNKLRAACGLPTLDQNTNTTGQTTE